MAHPSAGPPITEDKKVEMNKRFPVIASHGSVLGQGELAKSGTGSAPLPDPGLQATYLGIA
jgi:hypothetical protein